MSRARKWLRRGKWILLLVIVAVAGWLLAQPFVEAKANSQGVMVRFSARIDGVLYMAELREEVSQAPYHLIRDLSIGVALVEHPEDPSRSIPPGLWPLRVEAAGGAQRIRLVDALTDKVMVDEAEIEWLAFPSLGPGGVSPVSWVGDRLGLWPPGSLGLPFWRKKVNAPATLGRQYELTVYRPLAYKVIGAAIAAGVLVCVAAWMIDRWLRGYARGLCAKCGYDLRGTGSGRCPECGTEVVA